MEKLMETNSKPIIKNEHYEMLIEDLGTAGEGIGKIGGFAVFVEGVVPGDSIEVKIVKVLKGYGYGKLIRIINPSANRVSAKCPIYSRCGGCCLQELSYDAQLEYKQRLVKNALVRIGGFKDPDIKNIIGMNDPFHYLYPYPYRYRNKAQLPYGFIDGLPALGFYSRRSHRITAIDDCILLHPVNKDIIEIVNSFMREYNIPAYDEIKHKGLVRHILIKVAFQTGEIMVCIVINGKRLAYSKELVKRLQNITGMACICLSINTEKTNVILDNKIVNLYGNGYITDIIGGVKFQISPLSFFQVNPVQTEILYRTAMEYALTDETDSVEILDAYCGIGTVSLYFAKNSNKISKITGIEIVEQAVSDAKFNAEANGFLNAEFIAGDAENIISETLDKSNNVKIIVLDPPRKGCTVKLLNAVINSHAKKVVYISCDPATLARDLKILEEGGFNIINVQPVDMFPFTNHVETVCLLTKTLENA